jgi:hypothetical protein
MFRLLRQFGDLLDRIDLAGWTLTLSGMVVVAATIITPAYLEAKAIEAQCVVLRQVKHRTIAHHANYVAFSEALRDNDPVLLERLAWHHLRMQPSGAQTLDTLETLEDPWVVPSVDKWVAPPPGQITIPEAIDLPDSTLVRLITGEPTAVGPRLRRLAHPRRAADQPASCRTPRRRRRRVRRTHHADDYQEVCHDDLADWDE